MTPIHISLSKTVEGLLVEADRALRRQDDATYQRLLGKAIPLAPFRFDLRYNLANNLILAGRPEKAVGLFREMAESDGGDAEALFHLAHWLRHAGDEAGAEQAFGRLDAARPEMAADLRRIHAILAAWLDRPVSPELPDFSPPEGSPFLMVLGYRLEPDGAMHPILIERLEKALEAAGRFPFSPILVSGGLPRKGRTEAEAMRGWLIGRGIASSRILSEFCSRDLADNLAYSWRIAARHGRDAPILCLTSAVDVRRAGAGLESIGWNTGRARRIAAAASPGPAQPEFAEDGRDRLKLFRDALRCYGLPMFRPFPEAERD